MIDTAIVIKRDRVYHRGRTGPAWTYVYEAYGPDGRRFDNSSLVEIRRVLRQRYPGTALAEPWKS